MSELRDRIAAVVDARIKFWRQTQGYIVDGIDGADLADAVIAELRLHPVESLDRRFIRWVTAWRNNPELSDDE